ncbi:site-specific DNA-methyltransferase, partial [Vibrio anguillarum]|nr:site-specific DNA-methyltransferase [Vibrio anguillarum]
QMCSHWFSESQWALPNEDQYLKLQRLFDKKRGELVKSHHELVGEYNDLNSQYQTLVREFDGLKAEYEHLRRPFSVTSNVPYTDV